MSERTLADLNAALDQYAEAICNTPDARRRIAQARHALAALSRPEGEREREDVTTRKHLNPMFANHLEEIKRRERNATIEEVAQKLDGEWRSIFGFNIGKRVRALAAPAPPEEDNGPWEDTGGVLANEIAKHVAAPGSTAGEGERGDPPSEQVDELASALLAHFSDDTQEWGEIDEDARDYFREAADRALVALGLRTAPAPETVGREAVDVEAQSIALDAVFQTYDACAKAAGFPGHSFSGWRVPTGAIIDRAYDRIAALRAAPTTEEEG